MFPQAQRKQPASQKNVFSLRNKPNSNKWGKLRVTLFKDTSLRNFQLMLYGFPIEVIVTLNLEKKC
jgi:hypothetical protein